MSTLLLQVQLPMSSLDTAMAMLKLIGKERPVLRVGEISRELKMQKSTASRLLRKLADHGLLAREMEGYGYVAGRLGLMLADLYLSGQTLLKMVDRAIETLVEEFGFVGYAAALSGNEVVILRLLHGRYPLRLVREVGTRQGVWSASIGRALLARKSDAEAWGILKSPGGPRISRAEAVAELARIRTTGTAATDSAVVPNIAAIGAAIGDPDRNDTLGFALSFPMTATDEAMRRRMTARVFEEAMRIGARFGDPFWGALATRGNVTNISRERKAVQKRRVQRLKVSA
jgi:DNA-binding IclR family transcriptional regulator